MILVGMGHNSSPIAGREFVAVQLSDLHVSREPFHGIDTAAVARAAVAHVARLSPDVVVVTGDLVSSGEAGEYEICREALDGLGLPYYVLPGNHDKRELLVDTFGTPTIAGGYIQYTVEDFPVRLVVLDTLSEGMDGGELDETRLRWLSETLDADAQRPTIVFMHHPPIAHGIDWVEASGFAGGAECQQIIREHPNVVRVACGHVHRSIQAVVGSALVCVAPGNADHVRLDLRPGSRPAFVVEPYCVLVHALVGRTLVTHTSYVVPAAVSEMPSEVWADVRRRNEASPFPRLDR